MCEAIQLIGNLPIIMGVGASEEVIIIVSYNFLCLRKHVYMGKPQTRESGIGMQNSGVAWVVLIICI
jgi:hypothetical protein